MKTFIFCVILMLFYFGAEEKRYELRVSVEPDEKVKIIEQKCDFSIKDDLCYLDPEFRCKIEELLSICERKHIKVRVIETYRSPERQDSLYKLRPRVTMLKGGESKHQYGLAVDIYMKRKHYYVVGREAEKMGLRWGGRWKMRDYFHFETKTNL